VYLGWPLSAHKGGIMAEEITLDAVVESNEILQEEVSRLRNSNRICRAVIRALRATNESLRAQVELAKFNDDTFKSFCQGDFGVPVANPNESGLLEPGS
jgi:hypothetical protein